MEPVTQIFTVQIKLRWWAKPFLLAMNIPLICLGMSPRVPAWAFSVGDMVREDVSDGARQNY
ncbi:hypothetical protein [Pseudomonas sp. 382]|uniref:hypothetical protein n=1 Tax=Pseudomonas sp. 382 TaxID=1751969 RepID=UPI000C1989FD|nr:hypothetical protein [Pseudomonas sp. 382]PIK75270.1 hypothetical protein CQW31_28140 [Pseudomonas sp. 382]